MSDEMAADFGRFVQLSAASLALHVVIRVIAGLVIPAIFTTKYVCAPHLSYRTPASSLSLLSREIS